MSGPEDGAPLLSQLWSCCTLVRQLQTWIPKAPEVSVEAKGRLHFPQGSSLLESWYLLSLGDTFNSWVERDILILRGTANLMESKGNSHLQPAACATWPLPTLAAQGALPDTMKSRACARSFLSVPVGPTGLFPVELLQPECTYSQQSNNSTTTLDAYCIRLVRRRPGSITEADTEQRFGGILWICMLSVKVRQEKGFESL